MKMRTAAAGAASSSIQTVLSVSEFHRFGAEAFADFTAGGELHPALKILIHLKESYHTYRRLVKKTALW